MSTFYRLVPVCVNPIIIRWNKFLNDIEHNY